MNDGEIYMTGDVTLQVIPAGDGAVQLADLEDRSYRAALAVAQAEELLWCSLAEIRDSGLWQRGQEPGYTFRHYVQDWLHEVQRRLAQYQRDTGVIAPAFGYGMSYAWKKLSLHRRFVSYFECPPALVLAAPLAVMNKLSSTLAEKWDYKTGAPLEINPYADEGLQSEFPDEPTFADKVRAAVRTVAAIPNPGDALAYISEKFGGPADQRITYRFAVVVFTDGPLADRPFLRACRTTVNETNGDVEDQPWFDWNQPWPRDVIDALAKLLSTEPIDVEQAGDEGEDSD